MQEDISDGEFDLKVKENDTYNICFIPTIDSHLFISFDFVIKDERISHLAASKETIEDATADVDALFFSLSQVYKNLFHQ